MILGLTGGYCSGKSTAAAILEAEGWTVIDVDALGHLALERSAAAVAGLLGPQAIGPDGRPDRRAIGAAVFADSGLLARYEALVHPAMNALAAEAVAGGGGRVCVDAALLYRLPVAWSCDAIIELRAPLVSRLYRAWRRDRLGPSKALARMASQRPLRVAGRPFEDRTIVVRNAGGRRRLELGMRQALALAGSSGRLN